MSDGRSAAERLAQQKSQEIDLREMARRLLELDEGEVAMTATEMDLTTALDYLTMLVLDAES